MEITELNHRVTMVGNLLFAQESDSLNEDMQTVQVAAASIQSALQQIQDITNIVNSVTSFLGIVDQVLDFAKTLVV
jgi:hypothetical protein